MNKIKKIDFAFLAFVIALITIIALLLALNIVYPWNWINELLQWELSLKYWHCVLGIKIIAGFWIFCFVFRSSNKSRGISDQQVDDYINQHVSTL